jgi:hypothetical protein
MRLVMWSEAVGIAACFAPFLGCWSPSKCASSWLVGIEFLSLLDKVEDGAKSVCHPLPGLPYSQECCSGALCQAGLSSLKGLANRFPTLPPPQAESRKAVVYKNCLLGVRLCRLDSWLSSWLTWNFGEHLFKTFPWALARVREPVSSRPLSSISPFSCLADTFVVHIYLDSAWD